MYALWRSHKAGNKVLLSFCYPSQSLNDVQVEVQNLVSVISNSYAHLISALPA